MLRRRADAARASGAISSTTGNANNHAVSQALTSDITVTLKAYTCLFHGLLLQASTTTPSAGATKAVPAGTAMSAPL